MNAMPDTIAVLVALDQSVISRTKKIVGIFRAATEAPFLDLRIMDDGRELTPAAVNRAIRQGVRGFIVGSSGTDAAIACIQAKGLPLCVITQKCRANRHTTLVQTDNAAIADAAAKTLNERKMLRSLAYAHPDGRRPYWSVERERRFRSIAAQAGLAYAVIPTDDSVAALANLPHPTGVFAANDSTAAEIVKQCERGGLPVPQHISVVGVDNDEFLCENLRTPLSSIEPSFEQEGYEAARAIIRMASGLPAQKCKTCGVRRIVIRKSTAVREYADAVVSRALDLIRQKATSGIGVEDVADHLRISSRLLSRRFHEVLGKTVNGALTARKLEVLSQELIRSGDPIARICERCGFGSENHPKKLFRRHFGVSMREWRLQHA